MQSINPPKCKNSMISKPPGAVCGLSYIPDLMEMAEDPRIQKKVITEFIDFLDCITDQLHLLKAVHLRHLRSCQPMPFDVIREVRIFSGLKGTRMKAYDKACESQVCNLSSSVDNIFKLQSTQSHIKQGEKKTKKPPNKDTLKKTVPYELQDIIGKKGKPIWHTVAQEKYKRITLNELKSNVIKSIVKKPIRVTPRNKEKVAVFQTKSEQTIDMIHHARQVPGVKPSNKVVESQMDMLAAYFAGFKTVEEHKLYLEALEPHWFSDLLTASSNMFMLNYDVAQAFRRLGQFYDYEPSADPFAKSKLCFILQSLPIWDVTRMTLQRATEFILGEIMKIDNASKAVEDWLLHRRLPYVVVPPIVAGVNDVEKLEQEENESEHDLGAPPKMSAPGIMTPVRAGSMTPAKKSSIVISLDGAPE